ncbi:MAG: hypothetical protein IK083_06235 [Abditibacteriota bacterium]|nr:hypothetical protein [Abditibacteriota bacterium]
MIAVIPLSRLAPTSSRSKLRPVQNKRHLGDKPSGLAVRDPLKKNREPQPRVISAALASPTTPRHLGGIGFAHNPASSLRKRHMSNALAFGRLRFEIRDRAICLFLAPAKPEKANGNVRTSGVQEVLPTASTAESRWRGRIAGSGKSPGRGKDPVVKCAGMIYFYKGRIKGVDTMSGHFRPNSKSLEKVYCALRKLYENTPDVFDKNFKWE